MAHGRRLAAPCERKLERASLERTPMVLLRLVRRGQCHFRWFAALGNSIERNIPVLQYIDNAPKYGESI